MFILILNRYLETVADIRILSYFCKLVCNSLGLSNGAFILFLVDQLWFFFSPPEIYSITVMHIKHGQDMYEQSQGAKSSAFRL